MSRSCRRAGPEAFEQAIGRCVEPDDVPTAVEPCADRRVGHDAVSRDDPAQAGPGVRLVRSAQAGHRVGPPRRAPP